MPEKHFQSVRQLINDNGHLSKLHKRIQELRAIQQKLGSILPVPLSEHLHVSRYEANQLLLFADSAAWATRFRYEKMQVLSRLRQNGWPALTSIDVQIKPFFANQQNHNPNKNNSITDNSLRGNAVQPLTKVAASHLLQLAERSPSPLKEKLLKLAGHTNKETSQ